VKLTNFTPPELNGRIVVDGHCSFFDSIFTTVFIILTDDFKVFTFPSSGFNVVNQTFAVWNGVVTELAIDNAVAGYPIKKVTSGGTFPAPLRTHSTPDLSTFWSQATLLLLFLRTVELSYMEATLMESWANQRPQIL
jgi:hypothetical protein